MQQVTLYTTPTCHFCHMAKDFLKEKGVAYTEKDVAEDAAAREEMVSKSGQMGVPVIDIDGRIIFGFDRTALIAHLGIVA